MKRINLLTLCLTVLVSTNAYSMEEEEQSPDLDLERLSLQERETQIPRIQRTQTPTRAPLQHITIQGSGSRAGTPTTTLRPIEADGGNRPGTPLRAAAAGTPTHVTPTMTQQMNELLAMRERGEIDDAELGRRVRALFPRGGVPTPRAQRENTPPQNPENRN